jgi:8-oxo-dGTP pyrophosphatase MutT (NUDIX family)
MTRWLTHDSQTVYENAWIRVREHQVSRPDGSEGIYGVVEVRNPAVFIVPITEAGEVVLIRMYRYTLDRESVEIPAGGTDGQDPLVAAERELVEETGYTAAEWEPLGLMHANDGVCNAPEHVFLARTLTCADDHGAMAAEGISEVLTKPWEEVIEMIRQGEIHDSESIAALMLAAVALGRVR